MATTADRQRLRLMFAEDPGLYDRVRPGCHAAASGDLARLAGAGPGWRVLEIGCGTGQATVPLGGRGCGITAVEPGPGMAALARRKLARFPRVRVITSASGDAGLPAQPFGIVPAATSFHGAGPAAGVGKSAKAPRPGGAPATISTHHVAGGTGRLSAAVLFGRLIGAESGGRIVKRYLTGLRAARRAG